MKKLLFVTLISISLNAFSQGNINQGDWMVGGDFGFSSSKYGSSGSSSTNLNFSPNLGYFFINQLAGGLLIDVSTSKSGSGTSESKNTHTAFGPFLRYYFLPSTQSVNVFAQGAYNFGNMKSTMGSSSNSYGVNGYDLKAGVAVFVVPSIALEISLGYNSSKTEGASDRYKTFMGGIGFQIHLPGGRRAAVTNN